MFRPQTMSKIEMAVPERDIMPVTEALATLGVIHLTPITYPGGGRLIHRAEDWREQAASFTALERRILAVMESLGVDEGRPPREAPQPIGSEAAQIEVERLEREVQAPIRALEEGQRRLAQLQRRLSQLESIAWLEVDLDTLRSLRYIYVVLGTMPIANMRRLETSLEPVPSVLVTLQRQERLATVALFGTRRDAEILERAARSAYLNPFSLPKGYRGTPAEAIAALQPDIESARQYIAECQTAVDYLHRARAQRLRQLLWRVRVSRKLVETITNYGRLRSTYLVSGWVPASQVPALQRKIRQTSDRVLVKVTTPQRLEEDTLIPVSLHNPPVVRAFQTLVTNYGYPRYVEMDPTLVVMLTFPLVFGIMFGDVGHGALLALLGLLLASRKVRALRGFSSLGVVVLICGIMAMIFGFLYGSVFGFEKVLEPLLMHPLENVMGLLLITIGIGVVLLSLGMVCNIVNAALARRWGHLLFDHHGLAGLIFYWSLLGLAASAFTNNLPVSPVPFAALTLISGLAVTFSQVLERLVEGHRPLIESGLATYLIQAPIELFETLMGLLSNTLSYVRMGAFAVAHGSLCMVIFIIAEIISQTHGVGYWVVVALGNLFVLGFEGMVVGIQTLRLEYYEFFSKFFSGGGMSYRPLTLVSRGGK